MTAPLNIHSVFFLRHGQIEVEQVLAGHTDFLLSEKGYQQLIDATSTLPNIQRVFSSTLSRCALFAKQFSIENDIPLTITDTLKEMDFGDWDGKKFTNLWQQLDSQNNVSIGDFWENPWKNPPPNGETMQQFTSRIHHWWQQFLAKPLSGNNLIITHAGVIKYLLAYIIGIEQQPSITLNIFKVPYAGCVRIDISYDEQQRAWPSICF